MFKHCFIVLICASANGFEFINTPLPPARLSWSCTDPALAASFERMFEVWNSLLEHRFTITKLDKAADIIVTYSDIGKEWGQTEIRITPVPHEFYYDKLMVSTVVNPAYSDHVMLHEIGHILGLAHSEDTLAVMYPTPTNTGTTLSLDDIIGICTLYGVTPPSTIHAHIQYKRKGFHKYEFSLPGFLPMVLNWNFGDGWTDTALTPVHKYRKKGIVAVSVNFGLFHDIAFVLVK